METVNQENDLQAVPAQPTTTLDADAEKRVASATKFLVDPRVRRSSVEQKVSFLKSKGLSSDLIVRAFEQAGTPITLERVNSVRYVPPPSAEPTQQSSTPLSQPNTFTAAPMSTYVSTQSRPTSTVSHTLFPQVPPPQPPPQSTRPDWRDAVIAVGAAALAGLASVKLFKQYSPYELRRKSEKRQHLGTRRRATRAYSGSETDRSSHPPLPAAPFSRDAQSKELEVNEEVKRLTADLVETKEALANERKRGADLAISAAKVRAEKQQLSRTNEKLSQEVSDLKEKLELLEKKDEEREEPEVFGENLGDLDTGGVEHLFPKPEEPATQAQEGATEVTESVGADLTVDGTGSAVPMEDRDGSGEAAPASDAAVPDTQEEKETQGATVPDEQ